MTLNIHYLQSGLSAVAPDADIKILETHISWVILTGTYAYKIKKPVDFGFLDFSTLERRHHFCLEEVRLNQRLAPQIYLEVVPITGDTDRPVIQGEGEVIDYAVKMHEFPQQAQLDRMLDKGALSAQRLDAFADMIGQFHMQATVCPKDKDYGSPARVASPILENFPPILNNLDDPHSHESLNHLRQWCNRTLELSRDLMSRRKNDGFIRECHGDLHLRNLAWVQDNPIAFDCIEFSQNLRWIDVMSDTAFLLMDLDDRHQSALASRFLNRYLEVTGDYGGVSLLRLYLVYRALVRAKVAALRLSQGNDKQFRLQTQRECRGYIEQADEYIRPPSVRLIITRGLSGSGKTTLSQVLVEELGAIRIRSDIERKLLAGLSSHDAAQSAYQQGLYSPAMTDKTYDYLLQLARSILSAGYCVVVDATFLKRAQREPFERLANELEIPYHILEFHASVKELKRRITHRHGDASDADLNVLEKQRQHYEPVSDTEQEFAVIIDTQAESVRSQMLSALRYKN